MPHWRSERWDGRSAGILPTEMAEERRKGDETYAMRDDSIFNSQHGRRRQATGPQSLLSNRKFCQTNPFWRRHLAPVYRGARSESHRIAPMNDFTKSPLLYGEEGLMRWTVSESNQGHSSGTNRRWCRGRRWAAQKPREACPQGGNGGCQQSRRLKAAQGPNFCRAAGRLLGASNAQPFTFDPTAILPPLSLRSHHNPTPIPPHLQRQSHRSH